MSKEIAFNIRSKNEEIKSHSDVLTELANRHKVALTKREDLAGQIEDATEETIDELETDLEAVDEEIKGIEAEQDEADKKKKELDDELDELQKELDEIQEDEETEGQEGEERNMNKELELRTQQIAEYIKTRALPADGVVSGDVGVIIPEEIIYAPKDEIETTYDLSDLVTRRPVKRASGKYNMRRRGKGVLSTTAELEKNPKLAKPDLFQVPWEVETYRGALAVSRESIDDAGVDLMNLVSADANDVKINTKNEKIVALFKTFPAKDASGFDDLKDIFNVELDPAYNVRIVASQTFYNELDKLKDKEGRYLLQTDITSPSGKGISGKHVIVVSDDLIGKGTAFIGDTKQAVLYSDRKEIGVRWVDHDIYGEYLQAGMRMGFNKADGKAGFYVTFTPEVVPEGE